MFECSVKKMLCKTKTITYLIDRLIDQLID